MVVFLACACPAFSIGSASPAAELATRTPWPTFTPTLLPTRTPVLVARAPATDTPAPEVGSLPTPVASLSPTPALVLPTTPLSGAPAPTATPVSEPTAAPTSPPSPTPASASVPVVESPGWALAGVRLFNDEYLDGLVVRGDLINDTGSPQALAFITGTFYDAQGQVIASQDQVFDYWPSLEVIPPGGRMPFELTVDGIREAASFKLNIQAEPSSEMPRQDLQVVNLNQISEQDVTCVQGTLQDPGESLQNYLVIVAVLYDDQNQVVNFGEYYEPYVEGGQSLDFQICVGPTSQAVARYEVRAWGL